MGQSAESSQMQNLKKGTKAAMIVANGSVAIRLKYKGGGTVTSVIVTTGTNIVMVTSNGGTDTYTFANYATMGALENAISSEGIFEARVLDALRTDATATQLVDGTVSKTTAGYYDVLMDTDVSFSLTYRCAFDRNVGSNVPASDHRVSLKEFTYFATLGGAAVNKVQVWEYDRVNNTETQVYQTASLSAAATTINFASGKSEITGGWNNDLIVRLTDAVSLANTGAYLQVRYSRE